MEVQDFVIQEVDRLTRNMGWDEMERARDLHESLRALTGRLVYLDAVWLVDPEGHPRAGSHRFPVASADLSDRDYFSALREGESGPVVSRPHQGKVTGVPFVATAARRRTADGGFGGVVVVSVKAETLARLYRGVVPDRNHAAGLVRSDGVFVIRDAEAAPAGPAPLEADPEIRTALAQGRAGLITSRSPADGVERLVAFRRVTGYPLYTVAAVPVEVALGQWWRHVAVYGGVCGGAMTALLLLALAAMRRSARERALLARLTEQAERHERAEAALRQSQKLEAIGKLTGGIAHDFNNMLTAVIGSLETIRRRAVNRMPELASPIDTALRGADRAATLIQRLLAFARQQPLNPSTQDLGSLASGLEDLLRRAVGEGVQLSIEPASGLWSVSCDPVSIETALLNLAINARDAMPEGGHLTVRLNNVSLDEAAATTIGAIQAGDWVCLSVSDTGVGMSETVRARAFDPFFTTKPLGTGTGLGLSQVYGIVRQTGGDARLLSAPGAGTVVEIYLPRHHAGLDGLAGLPPVPGTPVFDGEGRPSGPARILLVEDEAIVRLVTGETLRAGGHEVTEAADGHAALELLKEAGNFDLLVTDIGLPGLNGRQVAAMARALSPGLPVVFITGYAGPPSSTGADLAPTDRMVLKPFASETLLRAVAETLSAPSRQKLPLSAVSKP